MGAMAAALGAQKGLGFGRQPSGKFGYGFPELPQKDINAASYVANNVTKWPAARASTPKVTKPKVTDVDPVMDKALKQHQAKLKTEAQEVRNQEMIDKMEGKPKVKAKAPPKSKKATPLDDVPDI
jgi:hypothetical protein